MDGMTDADLFCVKASRFSVRDYLFLSQKQHIQRLKKAIDRMLKTGWSKYLSYREM
ncbi:hypothetical protein HMPREF0322_03785 [Desulfitobacterium hafniense DP7]|uniref:Uncharacterized protein n=1 Tax=Desulfitobacterium hafniense DP7 TaxID=537010 RepID=G9XS37_DESHA|nr:hypothetical protein HMPREF0322_03785 [Desulfitobacterium hafniense DP7]